MSTFSPTSELRSRHCKPCDGGVPALTPTEVRDLLPSIPGWTLGPGGRSLQRKWRAKDFMAALDFFNKIAVIAEEEDHHPDLYLSGYRNVTLELSTHALGGLSENDFILAAKINEVPFALKE